MMEGQSQEQRRVQQLSENLQEWRYILVLVDKWLNWEKDEYPMIMSGAITTGFFLFWFLNPPVLSALAFAVMCVCVADYVVPRLHEFGISTAEEWTDEKEAKYKEICTNMVWGHGLLLKAYYWARMQREQKPKLFFCAAVICLLFVGFIAGAIPNLFLVYILVTFAVLLPGLHRKGYLLQWKILFLQQFVKIVQKMREGRLK
ncbi:ADP-ribosylation factor-like protein 6-interacting protein 1 isoform X1 [Apostichopus japonicus]|uniref:ADP-ribosylation factor-like protein 6-interacting protein 1 isoform X1 n=1 Tax=Stichopus japonicus TaxID=307972 RepID=UPI003AB257D1